MNEVQIKVAFIGQASAGKSALITRMNKNTFESERVSTIGAHEDVKMNYNFEDREFTLKLLDTAGQEMYAEVAGFYIKTSDVAIVCFDPLLPKAEEQLKFWKDFINNFLPSNKQILVSTKSDLWSNSDPLPELVRNPETLPDKYNTSLYFETSSLNGNNVKDLMDAICRTFIESGQSNDTGIKIKKTEESTGNGCKC